MDFMKSLVRALDIKSVSGKIHYNEQTLQASGRISDITFTQVQYLNKILKYMYF